MARGLQNLPDRAASKKVGALAGLKLFLAPYRVMVIGALLALTLTATVSLILPIAVRRVVDSFGIGAAGLLD
ncbi:MAG TPA: ABC transporter, partial [Gemmobacter sp.]|nr:ABC transporter [Gemmobacter sp.]